MEEDILVRLEHWVRQGISPDMSAAREEIARLRRTVKDLHQTLHYARTELQKADQRAAARYAGGSDE